jgi:hypothetical protein
MKITKKKMTLDKSKHSVRLSVLNPQVRERVEKFDTGNDGELDINEAMQGLIALQKQSNNYKKMIWMLIPILSLMIAATFGTTILAINLTKDINQNDGILTSKSDNTPIRTVEATSKDLMFSSLFSNDYNMITKLHFGSVTLNVNGIYQHTGQDNTKTVYVNSDMIFLGLNQTGSFIINYNQGYETNPMAQKMYQVINSSFSEVSMVIDYYRSTYGVQPTFDQIQRYTFMYTVTTSKIPEEYSISDEKNIMSSNLVSGINRMEALEASGANECQDGGVYQHVCSKPGVPCWECTFTNDDPCCGLPKSWRTCASHTKSPSYFSDCKRTN